MNSLVEQLRGTWPHISLPDLPPKAHEVVGVLRRRVARHRRALAVVGSLLLHALVLLALLLPAHPKDQDSGGTGGAASGTGNGDTYAAIDLKLVAPATTPAVKTPDDPATEALDTPTETVKPPIDTIALTDAATQPAPADATAPSPAAAKPSQAQANAGGAGQAGNTSGAGTGDDLWSAIAPCWKRIAGAETLGVTLQISFSGNGGLSKPPVIVRAPNAAITPQSLRSEAQALDALAQCGAYPMAAGRDDVAVAFPKPN